MRRPPGRRLGLGYTHGPKLSGHCLVPFRVTPPSQGPTIRTPAWPRCKTQLPVRPRTPLPHPLTILPALCKKTSGFQGGVEPRDLLSGFVLICLPNHCLRQLQGRFLIIIFGSRLLKVLQMKVNRTHLFGLFNVGRPVGGFFWPAQTLVVLY